MILQHHDYMLILHLALGNLCKRGKTATVQLLLVNLTR
jgi:hypothetical protein